MIHDCFEAFQNKGFFLWAMTVLASKPLLSNFSKLLNNYFGQQLVAHASPIISIIYLQ